MYMCVFGICPLITCGLHISYGNYVTQKVCVKHQQPKYCWEPDEYKPSRLDYTGFWLKYGNEIVDLSEQNNNMLPPILHLRCGDVLKIHHYAYKIPYDSEIKRAAHFLLDKSKTIWVMFGGHMHTTQTERICANYVLRFQHVIKSMSIFKDTQIKILKRNTSENDWNTLRAAPKVFALTMSSFVFSAKATNLSKLKMFCPLIACTSQWFERNIGYHHS